MPAQRRKFTYRERTIHCEFPGCTDKFSTHSGLKRHLVSHLKFSTNSSQPSHHDLEPSARLTVGPTGSSSFQPPRTPSPLDQAALSNNDAAPIDDATPIDDTPPIDDATPSTNDSEDTAPTSHPSQTPLRVFTHPYLDGPSYPLTKSRLMLMHVLIIGTPCDASGNFLEPHVPRPPPVAVDGYKPFKDRAEFELADFLYREVQLSGKKLDKLMDLLAAYYGSDKPPPFANHQDLHNAIDAITVGEVPWQSLTVSYTGPKPVGNAPQWMDDEYTVWYRCPRQLLINQIGNRSFADEMDWAPKRVYRRGLKREYKDFMSGDWAWEEAVSMNANLNEIQMLKPT